MKNMLHKIAQNIIRYSFDIAVFLIESFSKMERYDNKLQELREYNEDTLGRAIANCLDDKNLKLVPRFESHDLKHVLLDYKMDPVGEIRLQAFMVGNGNLSIPSMAILIYGMLLLPSQWKTFYTDFRKGRHYISISSWSISEHGHKNLKALQLEIRNSSYVPKPVIPMNTVAKYGAFTSIFAGVTGMFVCLPFLFSENLADLVGAGFPFLGGAILAVGGLIALSNSSKRAGVA